MSKLPRLRGILFDFNGTLFFDSRMHLEAFHVCFAEYHRPDMTDGEIVNRIFGRPNRPIYENFFAPDPERIDEGEVRRFADHKEELYRESCLKLPGGMKLIDGAEQLLDYLKEKKIPYCLATGSGLDNVDFYRRYLNLDRWFGEGRLVYDDGTVQGKPFPDLYLAAAKKIGVDPSECLIFEDGTSGLLAAKAAGAGGKIALYEKGQPSPLTPDASADRVIHDLTGWKEILSDYGLYRD